jgi:hypothetical protein
VAAEADQPRERCAVHPERQSVGRCEDCGRPTCLDCAVPFRGRLLCTACASKALGTPEPVPRPVVRASRASAVAVGALLAVALGATIPPWHRSGTLTRPFGAWRPHPEVAPQVAVLALAGATGLLLWAAIRHRLRRPLVAVVGAVSLLGAVAIAVSMLRAPDFYAFTPAPFVALGGALLAAMAAFVGLAGDRTVLDPASADGMARSASRP